MANRIKTPCAKRTARKCKSARKSCKYVKTDKRSYCRKRKNRGTRKTEKKTKMTNMLFA